MSANPDALPPGFFRYDGERFVRTNDLAEVDVVVNAKAAIAAETPSSCKPSEAITPGTKQPAPGGMDGGAA